MNSKLFATSLLLVIILAACASEVIEKETLPSISLSASPTARLAAVSPTVGVKATALATTSPNLPPTKTIAPTRTPSVPTTETPNPSQTVMRTPVDWESLPGLSEVVLSEEDLESVWWIASYPLKAVDATGEFSTCLWDCAKYRYSNEYGNLTITLLRAGDNQKASSTVNKLRDSFVPTMTTEYTSDNLESMLPGSWLVIHRPADKYYISASTAAPYGNVVILVTNSYRACADTDDGLYCEGDLMYLADTAASIARAQVAKLARAGYPE